MDQSKTRLLLLLSFSMLMLSQLMCNMPLGEEETVQLAEELLGWEVGEGLAYAVDVEQEEWHAEEEWCAGFDPPEVHAIEAYEYAENPSGGVIF